MVIQQMSNATNIVISTGFINILSLQIHKTAPLIKYSDIDSTNK